jgi:hypothetical protein
MILIRPGGQSVESTVFVTLSPCCDDGLHRVEQRASFRNMRVYQMEERATK